MEIAVIKTGGKQYKVKKDDEFLIEKINEEKGSKITFPDILGNKKISAEVIDIAKGPKVSNLKFKNKTRYTKRGGHRQKYTKIKITDIK